VVGMIEENNDAVVKKGQRDFMPVMQY